jgi:uncharacterized membrane protein YeaQ/YmgE (transglycosylase-associated protein family)
MGLVDLLMLLALSAFFGFVGAQLMGHRKVNVVMMIIFGFVGALIGRWVATYFHLPAIYVVNVGGSSFDLVWSMGGCLLVIAVVGLLGQRGY